MYQVSFHCYYEDGNSTKHYQELELADIGKWIDCYKFTHPTCRSISVKVWFELDKVEEER